MTSKYINRENLEVLMQSNKKTGFFAPINGAQNVAPMKAGFTLAEVLITLGIIGVVAAVTLPALITNVQGRIRAEQIRTAKYKFTLATDKMNSLGLIGPYDSSEAFVNELKKHLKIAKVCKYNELEGCWPTDKVKINDEGDELEISAIKDGKSFKMPSDENNDYSSENVGIVTADGVPMIISYNKKCEPLDSVKEYPWTTDDNKPISNATAGCVAAVMDINGSKKPNKLSEDVALFNARGLGPGCGIEIAGKCFSAAISSYAPMTTDECKQAVAQGKYGLKYCRKPNIGTDTYDYYAAAAKICGNVSKLPSMEDLAEMAKAIYHNSSITSNGDTKNITFDPVMGEKFGISLRNMVYSNREYSESRTGYGYFEKDCYGNCNLSLANRYYAGVVICKID